MIGFISYSRKNQDAISILAGDLEELGHSAWFDTELTGGQSWWDKILGMIETCDLFVFALSSHSLESNACRREMDYAGALGKTILPVMVAGDVSMNLVPAQLASLQMIDYRRQDKKAAFALYKALENLPSSPPIPSPPPPRPQIPVSYLGTIREQIETSQDLNFQEQSGLVLQLKEKLSDPESIDDVIALLNIFRKRRDLLATVAAEIDSLLARACKPAEEPAPGEDKNNRPESAKEFLKTISMDGDTGLIARILLDIQQTSQSYRLKSGTACLDLSFRDSRITASLSWHEWRNNKFHGLKQLNWKVRLYFASTDWIKAYLLVIVTMGLALLDEKTRETITLHEAQQTWPASRDKNILDNISRDMIQAIKMVSPKETMVTITLTP